MDGEEREAVEGKEVEYEERIYGLSLTPTPEAGVLLRGCSTGLRTADGAVQNPAALRAELPPQGTSEDAPQHPPRRCCCSFTGSDNVWLG